MTSPEPQATALILAAGGGTRMGGPKALLEFEGQLLVERAVETALSGGCTRVLLVLGAKAQEVQQRADFGPARASVQFVVNPDWADGMGSSLRTGLNALTAPADAALVLLVDQPLIGSDAVRAVLNAWRNGARLASASYAGKRGHPVLLGHEHWPEAASSATGDVGARRFLAAHAADLVLVPCDALADPHDLDAPQDLAALRPPGGQA